MEKIRPLTLSDLSATMLLTLFARAAEAESSSPILVDEQAVVLRDQLLPLIARGEGKLCRQLAVGDLPTMLVRTMALRGRHFDQQTRDFLRRHANGVIVNLGCGLDTRFQRLDDGRLQLYDLDLPPVIAVKRRLVAETERYLLVGSSVLDFGWMEKVGDGERPYLFLAEGLFMYLPAEKVKELVLALQERFPGCELVGEVFNARWLQGWRGRMVNNKMQRQLSMGEGAMFQSGLHHSAEMEGWGPGIHFLDDWSYFDEDDPKMGILRLFRHWDWLRKMQWTVHYRLAELENRRT